MLTRRHSSLRSQRGSAIVEFALVFFPFILMMLGLMEGSLLLWSYQSLSHAAREGARFAVVHGEANPVGDDVIAQVIRDNAIGLPADAITVETAWTPDNSMGSAVQIRASFRYGFLLGSLIFPGNGITLSTTSRMTVMN